MVVIVARQIKSVTSNLFMTEVMSKYLKVFMMRALLSCLVYEIFILSLDSAFR